MLIFLFLQYWDIDKPLVGWAKSIFCHCFFDRKVFFIDVPPMNCYNNAVFYRIIETIHRWIGRTDTIFIALLVHSMKGVKTNQLYLGITVKVSEWLV